MGEMVTSTSTDQKVYCKDCAYHRVYCHFIYHPETYDHFCLHPKYNKPRFIDTPIEQIDTEEYGCCYDINKNNDCKEFKKKRWDIKKILASNITPFGVFCILVIIFLISLVYAGVI